MAATKAKAGRYKPGSYKAPEPTEIEVEGVGSFLVRPLSNREQTEIQKLVGGKNGASADEEEAGYAYMAACLLEPQMTREQIKEDVEQWTVRQGGEFVSKVLQAAHVVDEEELDDVRRRFRPTDDDRA